EEEPAEPHRLDDEAAHLDDALLEDRPFGQRPAVVGREPGLELRPDSLVRPVGDVVVGIALEVEALDLRRARADQGEAALVVVVDQLFSGPRRPGEDAEPAERVQPRVLGQPSRRYGWPRDAVEAVAAGDEVAGQLTGLAVV